MRRFMTLVALQLSLLPLLSSCGARRQSSENENTGTPVENAFLAASANSGVPARIMMAVGYVESGLRTPSGVGRISSGGSLSRGPLQAESVFGLTYGDLALDSDKAPGLEEQIKAYGEFLKTKLGDSKPAQGSVTAEDKVRWIWALSRIHRGPDAPKNLLAVFTREVMAVLNSGFSVQEKDGVIANLEKESTPLRDQDLPLNYREDLQLDMYHAQIGSASLFSLARNNPNQGINQPQFIEVVHCPFSLSACIQMQNQQASDRAPMAVHYIIPSSDDEVPGTLQFARHEEMVTFVDRSGAPEVVGNRIVVMLTGLSGRYFDGQRIFADPLWMTDFQLRLLGVAVHEICSRLASTNNVNPGECIKIGGPNGVHFRNQNPDSFRWGDLVDWDESIVAPYLANRDGISSSTTLQLNSEGQLAAGVPFFLNAGFQSTTRRIELERLVRCPDPDRRVVWETIDIQQVRNRSSYLFGDNEWYDAGPNGSGDQYFRVKATGDDGRFMGWSALRIQISGFDKDDIPVASAKLCQRF